MSDKTPKLVHDAEPSPLSNIDIVWAMQSRLEKLFSLTLVTANGGLGDKAHVIQSHLSMASNSLVDELQILAEELSDRLTE
ncbi:hypothetical protein A9Q81_23345 [Gammaproteobacteria bacterium 42_54_T18]|nr:hypothetical protein A9Q81_23345 [Gammaproteobacteria bacterium 42_54_T18]